MFAKTKKETRLNPVKSYPQGGIGNWSELTNVRVNRISISQTFLLIKILILIKTFKHLNIEISMESELNGVFWPRGHIKSVQLSESPTYPGYDLTGFNCNLILEKKCSQNVKKEIVLHEIVTIYLRGTIFHGY